MRDGGALPSLRGDFCNRRLHPPPPPPAARDDGPAAPTPEGLLRLWVPTNCFLLFFAEPAEVAACLRARGVARLVLVGDSVVRNVSLSRRSCCWRTTVTPGGCAQL